MKIKNKREHTIPKNAPVLEGLYQHTRKEITNNIKDRSWISRKKASPATTQKNKQE